MKIIHLSTTISKMTNEEMARELIDSTDTNKNLSLLNESYKRNNIEAFYVATGVMVNMNYLPIVKLTLNMINKNPKSPACPAIVENILDFSNSITINAKSIVEGLIPISMVNPEVASTVLLNKNTPGSVIASVIGSLHLNITRQTTLDNSPFLRAIVKDLKGGGIWHNSYSGLVISTRIAQNPNDPFLLEVSKYDMEPDFAMALINASKLYSAQNKQIGKNLAENKNPGVELSKLSMEAPDVSPMAVIPGLIISLKDPKYKNYTGWIWNYVKEKMRINTDWELSAFNTSYTGDSIISIMVDISPSVIPEIIDILKKTPHIALIKKTSLYEEIIHKGLSNPSFRDKTLELPETYFQMVKMTKENAEIVDGHFHPPIPGYEKLEELMGKNKSWYKTSQNMKEILSSPENAYRYAAHVLKSKFELGEEIISKDALCSYLYARDVLKSRFPLGEEEISKDAYHSYYYALNVLNDRFELGEETIIKDPTYFKLYKNVFPQIEEKKNEIETKEIEEFKKSELYDLIGKNKSWYKLALSEYNLHKEAGIKEGILAALLSILSSITAPYEASAIKNFFAKNNIRPAQQQMIVNVVNNLTDQNKNIDDMSIDDIRIAIENIRQKEEKGMEKQDIKPQQDSDIKPKIITPLMPDEKYIEEIKNTLKQRGKNESMANSLLREMKSKELNDEQLENIKNNANNYDYIKQRFANQESLRDNLPILEVVSQEQGLNDIQKKILFVMRIIENGRRGCEFGVDDYNLKSQSRRFSPERVGIDVSTPEGKSKWDQAYKSQSLRVQAEYAAGTIKKRLQFDEQGKPSLPRLAFRYCPENWKWWSDIATKYLATT